MKVIILAAGQGTRLRPYTNDIPKCLVEIGGKSIIQRQLEVYENLGIRDISIVTGYKSEKLESLPKKKYKNEDFMSSNMVYSLWCAKEEIAQTNQLIVAYGDIIFTEDVLLKLINSEADISVVADIQWQQYWEVRMEDIADDAESFKVDEEGFIKELGQPINSVSDASAQYIGLMKFQKDSIYTLKETLNKLDFTNDEVKNMYFTDFLQNMINQGVKLSPVYIKNNWAEIDTVEDKIYMDKFYMDLSVEKGIIFPKKGF